jgi:sialidase-1
MESEYQYLWYHNNPPYRIPAIATRKDGKLLAINDYRPCGGDIGFGRVDLVQRIGSPDGTKWEKGTTIITGNERDSWNGNDGFGDPAICIDRETGRVLLMAVTGHTVCGSATRQNPNRMARFYSEDGGETYHSMTEGRDSIYDDITEEFYSLWDTEAYKAGNKNSTDQYTAQSFFIGSGRIFQSSKIKVGEYYRIYAALWSKDMHNRVAYSDDFGMTWHILGTRKDMPFPNFGNANEPKCEELPNGDVIMSARKPNGRYYNIFTYSDIEKGQGSWGTGTNSNISAPSDWNGTNGEITTFQVEDADGNLCNIALQSLPMGLNEYEGDVRRNVGFYFKDITSPNTYQKNGKNDVATFANGWQKGMLVSTTQGSAYSTFTLQNDGRIGFFYEETPGGYSMVYVPLTISEITGGKYVRIIGDAQPTDATPVEITYSYTHGQTIWHEQKEIAYVGETFPSIQEPAYVQVSGLPERKVTAEDAGKTFPLACTLSEDIPFQPSLAFDNAVWYSLAIRGTKYISYNSSTKKFPCATAKPSGDKALFAFVGNPFVGYKIQNLALGADKAVGGPVTNNGHVSPVDFDSAPTFVLENNSGHLVLRNTANSLGYLNDINSTLGYWVTSQAATDGGSTLTFTMEKDNATGIVETEPKVDAQRGQSQIFDLSGRRLSAPVKGVNIVNGKKMVF